jgi:hypothetical protein
VHPKHRASPTAAVATAASDDTALRRPARGEPAGSSARRGDMTRWGRAPYSGSLLPATDPMGYGLGLFRYSI